MSQIDHGHIALYITCLCPLPLGVTDRPWTYRVVYHLSVPSTSWCHRLTRDIYSCIPPVCVLYLFVSQIDQSGDILATSWEKHFMPYTNNKDADQPAHTRKLISAFVVRCRDSIIPLVFISEISSLYLASVAAQFGSTLVANPEDRFPRDVLNYRVVYHLSMSSTSWCHR